MLADAEVTAAADRVDLDPGAISLVWNIRGSIALKPVLLILAAQPYLREK
jgi:hypothetical protein